MHPELITLPGGFTIQTYGFFLMIGFLSAVWFAMRRASRVKADPDAVLDLSFWALLAGVAGARIFYVVHYWQSQYADAPSKFWAVVDIRQGGLEFLGGLLGGMVAVIIYLGWKKHSMRLFGDILAPSIMWGYGIGRLGCFFNGCCFGAIAVAPGTDQKAFPWAMRFPYGSPAYVHQWENRQVTIPAELMISAPGLIYPNLVPAADLDMSVERREAPRRLFESAREAYEQAKAKDADSPETAKLKARMEKAEKAFVEFSEAHRFLLIAQQYPSRNAPERGSSVSELQDLAANSKSLPVHPAQLYSATSGVLLASLLSAMFYRRKRHGVVFGTMLLLYPISRVLEEMIRADNPHDTAGLTVSQFISLGMFVAGVIYLYTIYKKMRERAPESLLRPVTAQTVS